MKMTKKKNPIQISFAGFRGFMVTVIEPGSHLIKGLWAHNPNFVNILVAHTWQIIIRSGHDFAQATTAQLSWHVQNCNLIGLLESILEQKHFFSHKISIMSSLTEMDPVWKDSMSRHHKNGLNWSSSLYDLALLELQITDNFSRINYKY